MNRPDSVALLFLLALGACQPNHELAVANGPLFALNPGRWSPTAQDLTLTSDKRGLLPVAMPVVERAAPVTLAPARPPEARP